MVAIDFHSRKKQPKKLWKSMGAVNCLFTNILRNIFFSVQQTKETRIGLEQHIDE